MANMSPAAGAAIGAGISGLASSVGGKKSSDDAVPQIPAIFGPALSNALGFVSSSLRNGLPSFGGPLSAGLNPLQGGALGLGSGFLGAGQQGFQTAFNTTQQIAESGLRQEDLKLISETLQPLFSGQQRDLIAQTRESTTQGGRFFGSGGVGEESRAFGDLISRQGAQTLGAGFQNMQARLQGAQGFGETFRNAAAGATGLFGLGEGARQVEQQALTRQYQEFLRTQPQQAISMLSSLMGGTPFFFQPQAPNLLQTFGAQGQQAFSNPAFLDFLFGGNKN